MEELKEAFDIATLILAGLGIFQAIRRFPRYWRYRAIRRFMRLRPRDRTIIICSELEEPEERQWVEPEEFIYMMKYGDIDALFELTLILRTVYPDIRLEVLSAQEAAHHNFDYECDLVLIGGPDYNFLSERLIQDGHTRVSYGTPANHGDASSISICVENHPPFQGMHKNEDFGYIESMPSPFSDKRRLVVFGGCHTVGVTAATRVMQLRRDGSGLTDQAKVNLKRLNRFGMLRRQFGVIFRATLLGSTIVSPNLSNAHFFGEDGRLRNLIGATKRVLLRISTILPLVSR